MPFNENDNSKHDTLKVCASEQESSKLELLLRAQPKLNNEVVNTTQKSMEARIDKWLWAVRLYKTRSMATDACKKGQVTMNGVTMKPSKSIKEGDVVSVRKPPITYTFRVLKAIENRVGAKLVPEMLENITPKEQYDILEMSKISGFANRMRGTGRPTKKERRDLDEFLGDDNFGLPDFLFFDDEDDSDSED